MALLFGEPLVTFAVGRGKAAKQRYALAPLDDIVSELRKLPADISNKYQSRALKRASRPGKSALLGNVASIGKVTGNLYASVDERTKKYTNNRFQVPVSVVVIGFRRPVNAGSQKANVPAFRGGTVQKGPNRAYHSHLVEFGSKGRRSPGKSRVVARRRVVLGGRVVSQRDRVKEQPANNPRGILSSLRARGPFSYSAGIYSGGRGDYPKDFIATGSVAPMPALRPLERAFKRSLPAMRSILDAETRKGLTQALREVERRNRGNQ